MFLKYVIALGICLLLWSGNAQAAFPIVIDSTQQTAAIATTHAAVSKAKAHSYALSDLRGVLSLIFGIIGLFFSPLGILAIILGSKDRFYGDGCAKTGFTLGIIDCVLLVCETLIYVFLLRKM
jgi:hypothetical protein